MGNVNIKDQLKPQGLSEFQIAKLTYDFQSFFDLNKDGYLSYKVSIFFSLKIDCITKKTLLIQSPFLHPFF